MLDRREAIHAQLEVIAAAVPSIANVHRNQNEVSDLERPCIVIIDGDEEAENDPNNRPSNAPRRIILRPHISIYASADPEKIGTVLNGFRIAFYKAIVTDVTLNGLCLDHNIKYHGCTFTLSRGRAAEGELELHFEFIYPLKPVSDL